MAGVSLLSVWCKPQGPVWWKLHCHAAQNNLILTCIWLRSLKVHGQPNWAAAYPWCAKYIKHLINTSCVLAVLRHTRCEDQTCMSCTHIISSWKVPWQRCYQDVRQLLDLYMCELNLMRAAQFLSRWSAWPSGCNTYVFWVSGAICMPPYVAVNNSKVYSHLRDPACPSNACTGYGVGLQNCNSSQSMETERHSCATSMKLVIDANNLRFFWSLNKDCCMYWSHQWQEASKVLAAACCTEFCDVRSSETLLLYVCSMQHVLSTAPHQYMGFACKEPIYTPHE